MNISICKNKGCENNAANGRKICHRCKRIQTEANAEPCSVDSCSNPSRSKGLCALHYKRFKTHGSALAHIPPTKGFKINSNLNWLLQNIDKCGESECLLWPFATTHNGYALVSVKSKTVRAARYVLFLSTGHYGLIARHKCRNRHCVNPNHLEWGTPAENTHDMIHRDKTTSIGEDRKNSKLTNKQTLAVYHDPRLQQVIADQYGIDQSTVSYIKSGQSAVVKKALRERDPKFPCSLLH